MLKYIFLQILKNCDRGFRDSLIFLNVNLANTDSVTSTECPLTVCIFRAVCQSNGLHPRFCQETLPSSHPKVMCLYNINFSSCTWVKALLDGAIFLASCLAILLHPCKTSCTRRFLRRTTWRKLQLDSTLCNGHCSKNLCRKKKLRDTKLWENLSKRC